MVKFKKYFFEWSLFVFLGYVIFFGKLVRVGDFEELILDFGFLFRVINII